MKPDRLCRTCQQRMDAVLWAASRHPGCGSSPPISDQAEAQLIDHLATSLGAVALTEETTQLTSVSGVKVTAAAGAMVRGEQPNYGRRVRQTFRVAQRHVQRRARNTTPNNDPTDREEPPMTSTADERDEGRTFARELFSRDDNDTADPGEAADPANHVPREGTNPAGPLTGDAELRQFANDLFTN